MLCENRFTGDAAQRVVKEYRVVVERQDLQGG